jgi:crotonobetainyl-CoA:carnitine CoA-transferase CaiB-like acyl-CoA transferase
MMLADMGADAVRIERPGGSAQMPADSPLLRNRRCGLRKHGRWKARITVRGRFR